MENNELALLLGTLLLAHGTAISTFLYKTGKAILKQIIEYKSLQRDILELQRQRERDYLEFKETTEKVFKDIRGVRLKIKD